MKKSMLMDIHVHSTLSKCSQLSLDDILDQAGALGLDGLCITDHDTMDVRHLMKEGLQPNGLCVIFGMEYETSDGDFLLFGPFEHLPLGLPVRQLLPLVDRLGGVSVAAHPFRPGRSVSEFVVREGLCSIVERYNGRNSVEANERSSIWFDRYDLTPCGGSDAHALVELGTAPSRILSPVSCREEFIDALRANRIEPVYSRLPQLQAC